MRIHISVFAVISVILLFPTASRAQKYEPRVTWPYIYSDFREGVIRFRDGSLLSYSLLNVNIVSGKIHYVDNEVIKEADMSGVLTGKIGEDVYLNTWGRMMVVLAETEYGAVLCDEVVDEDELGKTDIGYGVSSSTASSQHVASLDLSGSGILNTQLTNAELQKSSGKILPTVQKRYLFFGSRLIPATKKDILNDPDIDSKAAAAYIKENKVKWSDAASLADLVTFLGSQE